MSSPAVALKSIPQTREKTRSLDFSLIVGIAIALLATVAGIAATGVKIGYFLQPTGALIVLGGTLGVMFITTPLAALAHAGQRIASLLWTREEDRVELINEILGVVRTARATGILGIEPMIERSGNLFLREALQLAIDVQERDDLKSALEMKIQLRERDAERDAKTLEVAGGFAPTIGVLGTVVGLIDILRQFSNLAAVANGIALAFVSTIYGLGLANLVLLPAAHRIRARAADEFETNELILEGVLCLFDGLHPSLVRDRLTAFLREK